MRKLNVAFMGCVLLGVCLLDAKSAAGDERQALGGFGAAKRQTMAETNGGTQAAIRAEANSQANGGIDPSSLSDEQRSRLGAIFQQLDADLQNLQADAETQIGDLVGNSQQLSGSHETQAKQQSRRLTKSGKATTSNQEPPPPPDRAQGGEGEGQTPSGMEQLSNLTEAQRAEIEGIMGSLRMATDALESQAHEDFEAILASTETASLDPQNGQGDSLTFPSNGQTGIGGSQPPGDPPQLSEEQQTQADAIFAQLRTDMDLLHEAARADVLSLLTDEQKSLSEASSSTATSDAVSAESPPAQDRMDVQGQPPPMAGQEPPPPREQDGRPDGGDALDPLVGKLNLTSDQSQSVANVLDGLRTSVQTRVQEALVEMRAVVAAGG